MQASRLLILIGIIVANAMCHAQDSPQRDGLSFERAIIVPTATSAKGRWELAHFPPAYAELAAHGFSTAMVSHNGRRFDVYEVQSKAGEKISVYFDLGPDVVSEPNQALQLTADRRVTTLAFYERVVDITQLGFRQR